MYPRSRGSTNAQLLERRHLREHPGRCLHERPGEQASCPFAETHVQVEEWFQFQRLQDDSSPWLGRAVARDYVSRRVRSDSAGHERGGVRDYAVEYDGDAVDGAGQDHSDDGSVLQTTDLRKNPKWVFGVWRVQLQCLFYHVDLELQSLIVDARAPARALPDPISSLNRDTPPPACKGSPPASPPRHHSPRGLLAAHRRPATQVACP